ncbi:uncharacterized protein H6S33_004969 [Morchella sextelata]|uniref:uncharacterized protein n=1 Tax=Morchella sextelata TaxID=1174677 RepID=UPI001D04CD28|nr:uncharacterized protein H6S33_004969 [Morchella sextelata]KAH0604987.1 hypothetical protein H6S33_004969 [Morchella sextelata]
MLRLGLVTVQLLREKQIELSVITELPTYGTERDSMRRGLLRPPEAIAIDPSMYAAGSSKRFKGHQVPDHPQPLNKKQQCKNRKTHSTLTTQAPRTIVTPTSEPEISSPARGA